MQLSAPPEGPVKAMLLAAGRGERMGPLTADLPKPLLSLGAETLIERHLRRLAAADFSDIVINLSYRGGQIRSAVGEATPWGQTVAYSEEGEPPLETAGGIVHALPLLGDGAFLMVSTDVVTDYDFAALREAGARLGRASCATGAGLGRAPDETGARLGRAPDETGARLGRAPDETGASSGRVPDATGAGLGCAPADTGHLVLVPNPPHHPDGDFGLTPDGRLAAAPPRHTFSGIAVLRPALFRGLAPGIRPLRDVLHPAVRRGALLGEVYEGLWRDVGTPERLAEARALMGTG